MSRELYARLCFILSTIHVDCGLQELTGLNLPTPKQAAGSVEALQL